MKLAVHQGGGATRVAESPTLGVVRVAFREPCQYGRHLVTVVEVRRGDSWWHVPRPHDCPARPTPARPPTVGTALSDLVDHDEHEEGGIGA